MNPERMAMHNIDRGREKRLELSPIMLQAHEKIENEVLSNPDYSIQESDFAEGEHPVYTPEEVAGDIALADRLKKKFAGQQSEQERNSKIMADTFEGIMLMESEQSNWFGNATTLKSSNFDDLVNKVDMVAEWKMPGGDSEKVALAVDLTYGHSTIEKKFSAIKEEIDRGKLGSMKYYKDSSGNMGPIHNVPRMVVGVSQPVVEEITKLWLTKDTKALGNHPIQLLLAGQMTAQLSALHAYATKRENYHIAQSYSKALAVIKRLRDTKTHLQLGNLSQDPVWQEIMTQTRQQLKS